MKKLYVLVLSTITSLSFAQSVIQIKDEDNGGAIVTNNQIFTHTVAAFSTSSHHFQVKNISAATHTYIIRRTDNTLHTVGVGDKAAAYFCVDTYCYNDLVTSTTTVLSPNQTFSLIPKLDEASVMGVSNISYEVSDFSNGSDIIMMELKYNAPVGVKENTNLFSFASSIYPNPASTTAFIDVTATNDLNSVSVKIYNSLGAIVSDKKANLSKGKNTLSIDTQSLESGMYFVRIGNENARIVKKLTIN